MNSTHCDISLGRPATGAIHGRLLALAITLLILATPAFARAETLSFDSVSAYPVGANPKGVSAGDCDGDGISDLIVGSQNSNSIEILHNLGDGRLEFGGGKTNITQPMGAACGDWNGDGLIDIATLSRFGEIGIYYRDNAGAFNLAGTRAGGVAPTSMIAEDLNGDDIRDLVVVDSTAQDLTILLNTGTNTLPPSVRISAGILSPHAAAVADFDKDGHADIAVAGATAPYVVLLFGNGVGFATRPKTFPSPFSQTQRPKRGRGIAAGDINQDGNQDLALLSSDGIVTLFLGSPSGQFSLFDAFSVSSDAEAIALAYLNDDDLPDLALVSSETNSVQVFLAIGQGKFDLPNIVQVASVKNGLGPVASRVVLSDPTDPLTSVTQLIAANGPAKNLALVEQSDPTQLGMSALVGLAAEPSKLVLGDVTGDGIADAVVVTKAPRGRTLGLQVLIGNSNGQYNALPQGQGTCGNGIVEVGEQCDDGNLKQRDGCSKLCTVEVGKLVPSLTVVDLDGDAFTDLVLTDDRGQVWALLSDGQGRFRQIASMGMGRKKAPAAVGDFNGDGTTDLLIVSKKARAGALTLLANNGAGGFVTTPLPVTLPVLGPLLAADFDRDGNMDVAAGFKNGWAILYNDGAGPTRAVPTALAKSFKNVTSFTAADFDEDGWFDVLATFGSTKVPSLLFRGSATGTFKGGESVDPSGPVADPFAVDLDQDDHQDIVSCAAGPSFGCRVLYGNGTGKFGAAALPSSSAVGRQPRAAAAADFDHDGLADLVGISRDDDRAVVLFAAGTPQEARLVLTTGSRPSDVEIIDLNHDTFPDFVVGNEASRDLNIFLNQQNRQFLSLTPLKLPSIPNSSLGLIALAAGDINGDGISDLAVVQAGGTAGGVVTPLINIDGVGLAAAGSYPVGKLAWGIAVGHINGDDILDIVTANRTDNSYSVLLSQPDGTYVRTDRNSGGVRATDVAVANLDGVNGDDIVVTNEFIDGITETYGNVVTFLNDGTGNFGNPALKHVRGREIPRSVCSGDFDDDGAKDIAVASLGSSDIMVLFGAGNGTWRADERLFPVGDAALSVSCIDADADGRVDDIAFGRRGGSEVGLILTSN